MGVGRWLAGGVLGRWAVRWLLRGGPAAVAAKLAGVALLGIWRWRREVRSVEAARRAREIPADYEVLPPDALSAGPEPPGSGGGTDEDEPAGRE